MHHYDCFDLPWQVWFLPRAKCFRVRIPWAHQIPSSLPVRLIGPPYTVVLSHNILNIVTINCAIVYLPQIEARKSWTSHSSWALAQWLETESVKEARALPVQRWPDAQRRSETAWRREKSDLSCRPSAEVIGFLKVASFPLRLLFWKCIMDVFLSVDLLNLHLTIIKQCNDNKTVAFCNGYFNLWGFCKCVLMLAIWHLKVGLLN